MSSQLEPGNLEKDNVSEVGREGCGAEVKRGLLGLVLYNVPIMVALAALTGWVGPAAGGRGIRGYSLMLYSSVYVFGLLICIGLILRFRWWGVALAPLVGVVTILLV